MKKLVPFKKEIAFKTNVAEILGISLDHDLHLEKNTVKGNFTLSGNYKMTETSVNTENFNFELPFSIEIGEKYEVSDVKVEIDDFYYEIINNNTLSVNIEVALDNLNERIIEEEVIEEMPTLERMDAKDVKNLFENLSEDNETYVSYRICILKEMDTIESVILKYNISREELEKYNDLKDIKIGDKLIIPASFNETNK